MSFRIWDHVNSYLMDPLYEDDRDSGALYPSSAGVTLNINGRQVRHGGCRRKSYYQYMRYPKYKRGNSWDSYWKMQCGHAVEHLLGEVFKLSRCYIADEASVGLRRKLDSGHEYRISGRIDFIVQEPATGRPILIELKTKSPFYGKECWKEVSGKPMKPDIGHVCQTLPYIDWARKAPQNIEDAECRLMYMSREGDTGEHSIKLAADNSVVVQNDSGVFEWKEVTLDMIYSDMDHVAAGIRDRKTPDRDYELNWSNETAKWKYDNDDLSRVDKGIVKKKIDAGDTGQWLAKGDWQCRFCDFAPGCWGDDPDFKPLGALEQGDKFPAR